MGENASRMGLCQQLWIAGLLVGASTCAAQPMSSALQNQLVAKYCAVCHTDAIRNGGLSLEHYDAAQPDPPLAAMLLSKLNGGAMGAAGLGLPDLPARDAWVVATATQAAGADSWNVIRSESAAANAPMIAASVVRSVAPRKAGAAGPVYRLELSCGGPSRRGEIHLTWSPEPQTDRTFAVSLDGRPGIPHKLEGRERTMGNGSTATTGLASIQLNVAMPERSLTIIGLFQGETVTFPVDTFEPKARRQLESCWPPPSVVGR